LCPTGGTLDANLGRAIEGLRLRGIPIAVISNASLFWQQDVRADLLSITAVHPMREDAAHAFLVWAGAGWDVMTQLVMEDKLVEATYGGHRFYVRRLQ
jgi:hypothetical protein